MRIYYAVEMLTKDSDYWVEVEICNTMVQAQRLYDRWVDELKEQNGFNIRIVSKKNQKQYA